MFADPPRKRRPASLRLLAAAIIAAGGCSTDEVEAPLVSPPDRLEFRQVPSVVIAGEPMAPEVQVVVRRLDGEIDVTSTAIVSLTSTSPTVADTLLGTTTTEAVAGIASFPGLRLSRLATDARLFARAGGLTGAVSAPLRIEAGAATQLVFLSQPDSAIAGQALPSLRVELRDANGNRVTTANAPVTVSIATGPAGATITGTNTADLTAGQATLTNVRLPRAGTGYTLTASVVGNITIRSAITRVFTTVPAAPSELAFLTEPAASIAGAILAPPVRVSVNDAFGNLVPGAAGSVTLELAVAPAATQLLGTTTVIASAGIATFANIRVDRESPTVRLRATSPGLRAAVSINFAIGAP